MGFINPKIYAIPAGAEAFNDITTGDNKVNFNGRGNVGYAAGRGWDPCTGPGTPNSEKLIAFL